MTGILFELAGEQRETGSDVCIYVNTKTGPLSPPPLPPVISFQPFTFTAIHPSISLSIYPSLYQSINQSLYQSIHPSIHPSVHPSNHPSIHPSIQPSLSQSICLSNQKKNTHLQKEWYGMGAKEYFFSFFFFSIPTITPTQPNWHFQFNKRPRPRPRPPSPSAHIIHVFHKFHPNTTAFSDHHTGHNTRGGGPNILFLRRDGNNLP